MLNPRIRAKRLQAEYDRVRKLHESGGLIILEKALGDPPDRYLVRFTCRGIAKLVNSQPIYSEEHAVAIALTDTFPTTQPLMEWLTPIFHPNIEENGQRVCIGTWYPAKTLDQLVLMLGDMIQYKNYGSHDPLNLEASLWAMEHKELFPVDKRSLINPNQTESADQPAIAREIETEISVLR